MSRGSRRALCALGGLVGLGVTALGWSLLEARRPVLRQVEVACLAPGEQPLRILHLSDMHLSAHSEWLVDWVRDLAELRPDVVIDTGDNLAFADGLEPLRRALEPFTSLPGAFVLGDHDYRTTLFRLPTRYLRSNPKDVYAGRDEAEIALPWQEVKEIQAAGGWVDLTNTRGSLKVGDRRIELVGVDDAHADRDVYPEQVAEPFAGAGASARPARTADGTPLRIGLTHAPYKRVLDAMEADGVDLALAGHTHGGQLCLPRYGALVTNCDLDRARASGVSAWPGELVPGSNGEGVADADDMLLHVSAGLGTSPYTPVRFACRPEATLLTLVASPA